jgi:predicted dinucleotide-binding enzyme
LFPVVGVVDPASIVDGHMMKTAIIGMGNIGTRVAKHLVRGGEHVIVADRSIEKARAAATELGARAASATVEDAIRQADVLVLAIYFDAIKALLTEHRDALQAKIIVDPSNPIGPDGKGGFKKIIPDDQSAGQQLAALLPGGARLVKAFGTLAAASLGTAANRSPDRAVLFYATDDAEAGTAVAKLITASGFAPISVGGIAQSIRIEVFGDLHEMGKLGKLVSATEAAALV